MAHDDTIKHWELKDIFLFKPNHRMKLATIKLINNKYETAIVECDHEGKTLNFYIHFLNSYDYTEPMAKKFHQFIARRLQDLSESFDSPSIDDLFDTIEKEIPQIKRYRNSVPYEYPEDLYGKTY